MTRSDNERKDDAADETVPLWLKEPDGRWVPYNNSKITGMIFNKEANGVIMAFEVHDGTSARMVERNELGNRNFYQMNKYFEKMGITQAALRTEWYLTAKFVDS